MAQEEKTPLFSWRAREQLLSQRILVLDGVLDDDNGTLLTAQLLTLAADDPGADIALWIHSPGGSIPSGMFSQGRLGGTPGSTTGVAAMCVDDAGDSSVPGTAVQLATCTNGPSQNWTGGATGFGGNVRYLAPALGIGGAGLALLPWLRSGRWRYAVSASVS